MSKRLASFNKYLWDLRFIADVVKAEAHMNNVFAGTPDLDRAGRILTAHRLRIAGKSSPDECDSAVRAALSQKEDGR